MSTDTRRRNTVITVGAVVVLAVAAIILIARLTASTSTSTEPRPVPSSGATGAASELLVRDDSRILGDPADGSVTLVEFLDFECESCKALFPLYEDLRAGYEGKVRFVMRYFPLPSHFNAMNAALAVEAAAQQGQLEEMYTQMYQTQEEWGERQETAAPLFRLWAEAMGLDMAEYDRVVADPATTARIERDRDDGTALGVQGTPTLFLNGTQLELTSAEDLVNDIESAIAAAKQ